MKFKVYKASDHCNVESSSEVEIKTLEELIQFRANVDEPIILQKDYEDDSKLALVIYDDYIE